MRASGRAAPWSVRTAPASALGRVGLTRILAALTAPPRAEEFSLGAVSSRSHIRPTADSGRSWLIRAQMIFVRTIVMTRAHAVEKKLNPMPIRRSTVSTSRKTAMPTPQATYRTRQGNVALGGPSQTASTR
nr:hypothetical protein GCM10020241_23400 [Streptoalloteichus tenebrarius]